MEGPGQHQVVVGAEPMEALGEVALVDQPAGLVNDDERKDNPAARQLRPQPAPPRGSLHVCGVSLSSGAGPGVNDRRL